MSPPRCDTSALKRRRLERGLTSEQIAEHLQITAPHYYDLEAHADEASTTLTLRQLRSLLRLLDINLVSLFPDGPVKGRSITSIPELWQALEQHAASRKMSMGELSNKVGWELPRNGEVVAAFWTWNLDCLADICAEIGVDPCHLLQHVQPSA